MAAIFYKMSVGVETLEEIEGALAWATATVATTANTTWSWSLTHVFSLAFDWNTIPL